MVEAKGRNDRPPQQAENSAGGQGENRRSRQGQAGNDDIQKKEGDDRRKRLPFIIGIHDRLFFLQVSEVEILAQIKNEKQGHQYDDDCQQYYFGSVHRLIRLLKMVA